MAMVSAHANGMVCQKFPQIGATASIWAVAVEYLHGQRSA
jgi:hypothetical protein